MSKFQQVLSANVDNTPGGAADLPTVAAALAGSTIRVHAYELIGNGAVIITFTAGAAGTVMETVNVATAGQGAAPAVAPPGFLFEIPVNTALILHSSAAVRITGRVTYSYQPVGAAD